LGQLFFDLASENAELATTRQLGECLEKTYPHPCSLHFHFNKEEATVLSCCSWFKFTVFFKSTNGTRAETIKMQNSLKPANKQGTQMINRVKPLKPFTSTGSLAHQYSYVEKKTTKNKKKMANIFMLENKNQKLTSIFTLKKKKNKHTHKKKQQQLDIEATKK
jgi:hypothetical protein